MEPGTLIAGKFRVVRLLGEGGMGRVYEAIQVSLDRRVAVKVLKPVDVDPSLAARFAREARTVAKFTHPNIVGIFDFGEWEGKRYIAMEFVEGRDLHSVLDEVGPFPAGDIIEIVSQICDALVVAHEQGIIHRDLKPENVLMQQSRRGIRVVVLDFGIARQYGAAQTNDHLTRDGATCGTADYMAPEQTQGLELDGRADLYALGCMLYQMLTGKTPFSGTSPVMVMMAHLQMPAPDPRKANSGVNPKLARLAMRLMAKKPEDRPANAQDVIAELAQVRGELERASQRSSSPPSAVLPVLTRASTPPVQGEAVVDAQGPTAQARTTPRPVTAQTVHASVAVLTRTEVPSDVGAPTQGVIAAVLPRRGRRSWLVAAVIAVVVLAAAALFSLSGDEQDNAAASALPSTSAAPASSPTELSATAAPPPSVVAMHLPQLPASSGTATHPRRESDEDGDSARPRNGIELASTSVVQPAIKLIPAKTQEPARAEREKRKEEEAKLAARDELLAQAQMHLNASAWSSAITKLLAACKIRCTSEINRKLGDANRRLGNTEAACGYYRKSVRGMPAEKANALLAPFGCAHAP